MDYLYAPWREMYFNNKEKEDCPFCHCTENLNEDEKLGVIFRAKYCFGVMNKFPYSPGHFMIIPYEHIENIEDLNDEAWIQISHLVKIGVKILKRELFAKGVNIGMNLGSAAGAGIAPHCHYHLVPRWSGDTNFITTIANTRVCGNDLKKIYNKLNKAFLTYV
ncbi:HIT family protein [Campylobacter insulaenigrae]|uniref:HIT domain-containing protein n=1 Tax=Campylobacter insulaenigrae TaxID=260714 RepID=A0ABY3G417_9BACT|nr:HIT domain-containing protein [Campylobacter insulaenigrae]MCR6571761.1 HIT domain-containing protein [Campylobacter insulaenigrae]MCR6577911.1 HIT domain-containing protein [Campylobacter insulaenigrae]MCR6581149.1 HIT domain-containing protein [Campylobacter insulaenigrae]MCR6587214.1 HIT domain-containing protein [Campylobacter insulaenigrae]MCR6591359.1 HIT domain-containing protein [Campylobacter insulaenigrae]